VSAPTLTGLKPGDTRWFFGLHATIRATGAETDGAYTLVDVVAPPGLVAPLHVHHAEDEGFLVLEGSVTLYIGDEVVEARAGDFANGPRDVPHRFEIGPEGARMLWICTPPGFENLVESVSVPARATTPPPADVVPPADAGEIIAHYGAELLA
jgi:quercetin dioxygenase-like cupin family protein